MTTFTQYLEPFEQFVRSNWATVVSVALITQALVVFYREILTIKKAKLEIFKLKRELAEKKAAKTDDEIVTRASIEQIILYGGKNMKDREFIDELRKRSGERHAFSTVMTKEEIHYFVRGWISVVVLSLFYLCLTWRIIGSAPFVINPTAALIVFPYLLFQYAVRWRLRSKCLRMFDTGSYSKS